MNGGLDSHSAVVGGTKNVNLIGKGCVSERGQFWKTINWLHGTS